MNIYYNILLKRLKKHFIRSKIMEFKTAKCPECGRVIQAPSDLETVICTYCGSRFGIASEIVPETGTGAVEADQDYIVYYDQALSALNQSLTVPIEIALEFNRKSYENTFVQYYNRLERSLDDFNKAYDVCKGDKGELVKDYAGKFGRRILENIDKIQGKNRAGEIENYVYLYVAFAVPAVLKYDKAYTEVMADALLDTWNSRYPKRKLGKDRFEQINGDFRHKFCYITTAVTETLGLADNCYELQSFRRFRDEYMAAQPRGELQIMEYYLTAPAIVAAIDRSPCKNQVYRNIWDRHLSRCLTMYEQNRYEECRQAYWDMVSELREIWM
jgi:hypothetical protein